MKFDEKYWKEKCDLLQARVNGLESEAVSVAECFKKKLCDAETENARIVQNMTQELEALKQERDTLEEQSRELATTLSEQMCKAYIMEAKNEALLQALMAVSSGMASAAMNGCKCNDKKKN